MEISEEAIQFARAFKTGLETSSDVTLSLQHCTREEILGAIEFYKQENRRASVFGNTVFVESAQIASLRNNSVSL